MLRVRGYVYILCLHTCTVPVQFLFPAVQAKVALHHYRGHLSHTCTFVQKKKSSLTQLRFSLFDNYDNFSAANRHQRFQFFTQLLCDLTGCFFKRIIVFLNSVEQLKTNTKQAAKRLQLPCCIKGKSLHQNIMNQDSCKFGTTIYLYRGGCALGHSVVDQDPRLCAAVASAGRGILHLPVSYSQTK